MVCPPHPPPLHLQKKPRIKFSFFFFFFILASPLEKPSGHFALKIKVELFFFFKWQKYPTKKYASVFEPSFLLPMKTCTRHWAAAKTHRLDPVFQVSGVMFSKIPICEQGNPGEGAQRLFMALLRGSTGVHWVRGRSWLGTKSAASIYPESSCSEKVKLLMVVITVRLQFMNHDRKIPFLFCPASRKVPEGSQFKDFKLRRFSINLLKPETIRARTRAGNMYFPLLYCVKFRVLTFPNKPASLFLFTPQLRTCMAASVHLKSESRSPLWPLELSVKFVWKFVQSTCCLRFMQVEIKSAATSDGTQSSSETRHVCWGEKCFSCAPHVTHQLMCAMETRSSPCCCRVPTLPRMKICWRSTFVLLYSWFMKCLSSMNIISACLWLVWLWMVACWSVIQK